MKRSSKSLRKITKLKMEELPDQKGPLRSAEKLISVDKQGD